MILPIGAAIFAVIGLILLCFAATWPVLDRREAECKARYMKLFPATVAGLYAILLCSVPNLWLATLIFAGPAYLVHKLRRLK